MKKTLFLSLLLVSIKVFSQDWAPFKLSDQVQHYESILAHSDFHTYYKNQIQSVVKKQIITDTAKSAILFKKGYNKLTLSYSLNSPGVQIIKGQIFGDTAFIFADSSVFTTLDTFGLKLTFPHHYKLNTLFRLATKRNGSYFTAFVDSLYADTINHSLDSLAKLTVSVFDSSNTIDTSGSFHNSSIIISKSNGLIKGFNFTCLERRLIVHRFFSSHTFFTKNTDNQLTTNDEYHYHTIFNNSLGMIQETESVVKIFKDSISGSNRTLFYEEKQKDLSTPPSNTIQTVNYQKTFTTQDTLFAFESQVLDDSVLNRTLGQALAPFRNKEFYRCATCGFNEIGYSTDNEYFAYRSFVTNKIDTLYDNNGLYTADLYHALGIGDSNVQWSGHNQFYRKTITYARKGNLTWGTPFNLTVTISEAEVTKQELLFFPNPTEGSINFEYLPSAQNIQVVNALGKLMMEVDTDKTGIDLSKLEKGIYFIRVRTKNGSVKTAKVVKE